MNKKTALGAAVALAVVAYGGATWYLGQRAQASYQEALEEVRKVLGAETVVSQDYQRDFSHRRPRWFCSGRRLPRPMPASPHPSLCAWW